MGHYAARTAELEKVVADLESRAAETARSGGPAASPRSYALLRAEIADHARFRDAVLDDALELLEPSSDATAETMHARWVDAFVTAATDAFRGFKDLTLEDIPSQIVAESIASQESVALAEISTWRLARVQGEISTRLRTLETERAGLESKWSETIGQDERQDGQVAALRVQVLAMLRDSVEKIRGWGPRIEGVVRDAVVAWEGSERPSPDPSFADPTRTFVETLATLSRTLEDSTRAALTLYATEQTIHEVFGKHRAAVAELLEAAEPDLVEKAFEEAVAAADSGAGRMSYDGQRTDLRAFLGTAKGVVGPRVDAYESAFHDFVRHFDGRYTGTVSDATVELLAEAEFFDQFWRDIEDVRLPAVIQRADDDVARLVSVDLSRVTEEHRDELRATLERNLDDVRQSIRGLDLSVLERFRLQFIDTPRAQLVDHLRRLRGYEE